MVGLSLKGGDGLLTLLRYGVFISFI